MNRLILIALIASLGCACSKEKPVEKKAETAETPKKPAKKEKPPVVKISALSPKLPKSELGEIPTSEDLEAEAEQRVAVENLEAELDRLEAEIVGVSN